MSQDRYSRQTLFKPIGLEGQEKLEQSHVLIIGAGALGTSVSEMLARSGVGQLTIIDRDYVEYSNLQRQQLYTESDAYLHIPKAVAAEKRLREINSDITITGLIADLGIQEIEDHIQKVDLVIDATDNFETRMLINDASQKYKVPWIYGGCTSSYGLTYTIIPDITPCFSCLIGVLPMSGETCDTVGVISPAVQIVASHQAVEAFKILVGDFNALRKTLYYFNIWTNESTSIKVSHLKKKACPSCGEHSSYPYLDINNQTKAAILCGRDTVQIRPPKKYKLNLDDLQEKLIQTNIKVESNPFLLNATIGDQRLVVFQDGRVLIHGTKDIAEAKSLYTRYIGN